MNSNKSIARFSVCVLVVLVSMLPDVALAQNQTQTPTQAKALQVGILPISTTRALIKNYQPLRSYLERELNRPVELLTAPDFRTFHLNTIEGNYDLIVTAAHLGRIAETTADYVPLARYKAPHRTLLIVARDQPLKSIQSLRGKVVAGIDPIALGVNETVLWLRKQGLRAGADYTLLETPSPINAAYSVQNHQSMIAISSPQGLKLLPDSLRDSMEVFATLPELPSLMWLAHPRMKSAVPRLKDALLGFTQQSSEGALFYDATGYIGMREVTHAETMAMDALAHETSLLLNTKK